MGSATFLSDWMLDLSIYSWPCLTIYPRYSTRFWKKRHFNKLLIFNLTQASTRVVSISLTCLMWSSMFLYNMITSSKYTKHVFHFYFVSMMSSARWKHSGAFLRPKGIRVHSKVFAWHKNAILDISCSPIFICKYMEFASGVVKYCSSPRVSMDNW